MQIGNLSPGSSSTSLLALNRPTPSIPAKPASVPVPVAEQPPSKQAASAAPAPASAAPTSKDHGGSHGSASSDSSSASSADEIAATYTTTVAGKSYSGDVTYSDGQYVVSVQGLSGATATGSSVQSAEDSLGSIISELA